MFGGFKILGVKPPGRIHVATVEIFRYDTGKQSYTKSYFSSSETKPVTVHDFLLLLKLVLLSGGNGGDLDYSCTVTILTRLW